MRDHDFVPNGFLALIVPPLCGCAQVGSFSRSASLGGGSR